MKEMSPRERRDRLPSGARAARRRSNRKQRSKDMASANPGVSAAGAAARRTALDPSAGRAAIGGMLSVSDTFGEGCADPAALQTRLTSVVSDVAKLAYAIEALTLVPIENTSPQGGAVGDSLNGRPGTERYATRPAAADQHDNEGGDGAQRTLGAVREVLTKPRGWSTSLSA